MVLSWNEIKDRALQFSKEWADASNEEADAKPFLEAFFNVFGITRRKVAFFEHRVKKINDTDGYIDLLWKGTILIEMKSLGKDLDKALQQAKDYADGLPQHELPKYILVSDFAQFRLYDIEEGSSHAFALKDLVKNVQHFGYLLGYQKKTYKEQDQANVKAAELMGKLHDRLEEIGYKGHALEVYLVRLLFCLFAEDTTIFNKQQFQDFIEQRTQPDGTDLAAKMQELFQVLNTSNADRFTNLDEQLSEFPYVNGRLFEEQLPTASFDSKMRTALLNCCYLDWSKISPAIFGSMFQSVMNPVERRNLGAHYTSEKNILKLIKPLFLDELWAEFDKVKGNANNLKKLHHKISKLRFLDPACGCGNFLIIAYKELRLLEIGIVKLLLKGQTVTNISEYLLLDVDKFYGIEYEEFPARIAEVAMWLIDHQMNMLASETFGEYYIRLPLRKSATILHGNALQTDWQSLLVPQLHDVWAKEDVANLKYDYIMGNPPFIGAAIQNKNQKNDILNIFNEKNSTNDYVAGWFLKSSQYIKSKNLDFGQNIKCACVSTNSICQGEQISNLWKVLFEKYNITIHFAHKTFKWSNEAKGNAAVHVVIIGFSNFDPSSKLIYEYDNISNEPHANFAKNINAYLLDAPNIFIDTRSTPISNVPKMIRGNMPTDGGNLLLDEKEYIEAIKLEPPLKSLIKPFISAFEFLNNRKRYCLWLVDVEPNILKNSNFIKNRLEKVKTMRLASTKSSTNKLAEKPACFELISQPKTNYVLIPRHSSSNRKYVPFGYFTPNEIIADSCLAFPNATLYHFGIISSIMHMYWLSNLCGRIKSDYRYSNTLVYNNYPFPENPTDKQKQAIETCAQKVLDTRAKYPNSSLADLYDPLTMPADLVKAHNELDKAVDLAYRPQAFTSEAKRMEFLFELYEKYTAGLFAVEKRKKVKMLDDDKI
jgi:type I restriction-modification system DNA methylase subunit